MRALFFSGDKKEYLVSMEIDYVRFADEEEAEIGISLAFQGFDMLDRDKKEIYTVADISKEEAYNLVIQSAESNMIDLRAYTVE